MRLRRMGGVALLLLATVVNSRISVAEVLSSPPVDRALFRDGEVKRSTRIFGDWVLACDEIVRLKRRFCSLRTTALDNREARLTLDVSTGDDGQAAAMLHLPTNLGLSDGVSLRTSDPRSRLMKGRSESHPIALCTENECQSVWSMTPGEIEALVTGRGITLTYRTATMDDLPIFSVRLNDLAPANARISGRGFREAIAASVN